MRRGRPAVSHQGADLQRRVKGQKVRNLRGFSPAVIYLPCRKELPYIPRRDPECPFLSAPCCAPHSSARPRSPRTLISSLCPSLMFTSTPWTPISPASVPCVPTPRSSSRLIRKGRKSPSAG